MSTSAKSANKLNTSSLGRFLSLIHFYKRKKVFSLSGFQTSRNGVHSTRWAGPRVQAMGAAFDY